MTPSTAGIYPAVLVVWPCGRAGLPSSGGHGVEAITHAGRALEASAIVHIDPAGLRVAIDGAGVSPAALAQVIADAGYAPVKLQDQAQVIAAPKACGGGCGCH